MKRNWKICSENAQLCYQKRWNTLDVLIKLTPQPTASAFKRAMKDTVAQLFTESFHFVRLQTEKLNIKLLEAEEQFKSYSETATEFVMVCKSDSLTDQNSGYPEELGREICCSGGGPQ